MNEIKQINDNVHKKQSKDDQMFRYIHQLSAWHIFKWQLIDKRKVFFINDNLSIFTILNLHVSSWGNCLMAKIRDEEIHRVKREKKKDNFSSYRVSYGSYGAVIWERRGRKKESPEKKKNTFGRIYLFWTYKKKERRPMEYLECIQHH